LQDMIFSTHRIEY